MSQKLAYKRALLKLSGEAFAGGRASGIDFSVIERLSDELKSVAATGVQLGVVIGGGNILRGTTASEQGMDRVSADYMGMLATIINALALHVTSARPIAVRIEDVPADIVERERRVYRAQVAEEKKPEAVREKIVEGKLKKFYRENVLLEQPFVKDDKVTVGELVKALSGKTGEKVEVRRFARFELGGN